jgi:5-methylcytosine-specific restriction endonuclease McrA
MNSLKRPNESSEIPEKIRKTCLQSDIYKCLYCNRRVNEYNMGLCVQTTPEKYICVSCLETISSTMECPISTGQYD